MEEEVAENKNLEYKQSLDLKLKDHKRKLLKTASAFANTNGGLLIYGIKAKDGIPTELDGVTIDNEDKTGIQIEDAIRNNSEPRIPSIEVGFIQKTGTENHYILVKVQRSWNLPHRVKLGGKAGKFYLRRDRKNDEMDIFELKTAFNLSETLADKIKRFREERISSILSEETPIPMNEGAKLVLHLIPINAFYPGQQYNINKIINGPPLVPIFSYSSSGLNYTFEGLINKEIPASKEEHTMSYVHLYRDGIIEAVTGYFFKKEKKIMTSELHEVQIVNSIKEYLKVYTELNIEFPVFVFITLVGVKGYIMDYEPRFIFEKGPDSVIERVVLATNEIILKKYPDNVGNTLKPAFDAIKNAFGFKGSINYNEKGEWEPK